LIETIAGCDAEPTRTGIVGLEGESQAASVDAQFLAEVVVKVIGAELLAGMNTVQKSEHLRVVHRILVVWIAPEHSSGSGNRQSWHDLAVGKRIRTCQPRLTARLD